jgi:hypothetical protein
VPHESLKSKMSTSEIKALARDHRLKAGLDTFAAELDG